MGIAAKLRAAFSRICCRRGPSRHPASAAAGSSSSRLALRRERDTLLQGHQLSDWVRHQFDMTVRYLVESSYRIANHKNLNYSYDRSVIV
jgi:hypothetical protein